MIVGLDVGGTHIDAVIIYNKKIIKIVKNLYEKDFLETYILKTLNELLKGIDPIKIKYINLSTTISTNAIIENKISKVGMIIQSGPGVALNELKVNDNNYFISGYTDHRGIIIKDFDYSQINLAKQQLKNQGITDLAIATKFSIRNPKTELSLKEILKADFNSVSLSHKLSGNLNFPRRINTTYLNAAIYSIYKNFIVSILKALKEKQINCPVYILKADAGIIEAKESVNTPVLNINSGSAASLMGILSLCNIKEDAILLDIGGTTTDIFVFAKGDTLFEPLGIKIGNYKTLVRAVYSNSIGLGGDSSINIFNGKLKIGPIKEGKPYSLGGLKPTLTDAFVYLGLLNIGLSEKAEKAMSLLASELFLSVDEVANKIIELFVANLKFEVNKVLNTINNKPVYTIKELLHQDLIVPKKIYLIGGPAKLLKDSVFKQFQIKCVLPIHYNIANAIGAALSKITAEVNLYIDTSNETIVVPELGIIEKISKNTTLEDAKKLSFNYLKIILENKRKYDINDFQIITESSFNMIEGYSKTGKNIRVKAQVRPGLVYKLDGGNYE